MYTIHSPPLCCFALLPFAGPGFGLWVYRWWWCRWWSVASVVWWCTFIGTLTVVLTRAALLHFSRLTAQAAAVYLSCRWTAAPRLRQVLRRCPSRSRANRSRLLETWTTRHLVSYNVHLRATRATTWHHRTLLRTVRVTVKEEVATTTTTCRRHPRGRGFPWTMPGIRSACLMAIVCWLGVFCCLYFTPIIITHTHTPPKCLSAWLTRKNKQKPACVTSVSTNPTFVFFVLIFFYFFYHQHFTPKETRNKVPLKKLGMRF